MQRSVRRSELESDQSSPSPSPQPELLARLKSLNDLDFIDTQPAARESVIDEQNVEDELAFNLFATTNKPGPKEDVKIRLRSPTPDTRDPGFIQSERALQYYVANSNAKQQESFLNAAISGNQIMRMSALKWSGMAYPWKILYLKQSSLSKSLKSGADTTLLHSDSTTTKRRRKGKQARVKLRRRHAVTKLEEDEKKAALEAKEAALQAAKTRKNREKKQRQRARDRAKKAANNDVAISTDEMVTG